MLIMSLHLLAWPTISQIEKDITSNLNTLQLEHFPNQATIKKIILEDSRNTKHIHQVRDTIGITPKASFIIDLELIDAYNTL